MTLSSFLDNYYQNVIYFFLRSLEIIAFRRNWQHGIQWPRVSNRNLIISAVSLCVWIFFSFARPATLKKREIFGRSFEKFFMTKIVPLPYILFIV